MRITFLLPILLVASLSGCAARLTTVTNLPAGVTSAQVVSWDTAVKDLDDISQTTSTIRKTLEPACLPVGSAAIPVTACKLIFTDLGKVDTLESDAAQFLEGVPQNWNQSISAKVTSYTSQISDLIAEIVSQGVVNITNSSTVASVNKGIAEITADALAIAAIV